MINYNNTGNYQRRHLQMEVSNHGLENLITAFINGVSINFIHALLLSLALVLSV